jgi:hypothetical protein
MFILAWHLVVSMSLISTLSSSSSSMSSLTSTTSSAISLNLVLTCAVIAACVLIFLLSLNELYRNSWNAHTAATRRLQMVAALIPEWRDSFNANRTTVLRIICVPLIITFCAFFVFKIAAAF